MNFEVTLIFVENADFHVRDKCRTFLVGANDLMKALRTVDEYLYRYDVTLNKEDYTITSCNEEETEMEVTFADSEKGLSLNYSIIQQYKRRTE